MTDYYEEKAPSTFNKNLTWEQYLPETMELEHTYAYNHPREIKYDLDGKEIGSLILGEPPAVADLKNKIISSGLLLEDFIPFAWGYKNYGMAVEFHPRETLFGFGNWGDEAMAMVWAT